LTRLVSPVTGSVTALATVAWPVPVSTNLVLPIRKTSSRSVPARTALNPFSARCDDFATASWPGAVP
jgi:hypothetical protein